MNYLAILSQLLVAVPQFQSLFTAAAKHVGESDADIAAALNEARALSDKFATPDHYFGLPIAPKP